MTDLTKQTQAHLETVLGVEVRARIDRIDDNGNIREHILAEDDPARTLCGLVVYNSQKPIGNRTCKRCEALHRRTSESAPTLAGERASHEPALSLADRGPGESALSAPSSGSVTSKEIK